MNKTLLTVILLTALTGCTTEAYWTNYDYEQIQAAVKICEPHGGLNRIAVEGPLRSRVSCNLNGVTVSVGTPGNRR